MGPEKPKDHGKGPEKSKGPSNSRKTLSSPSKTKGKALADSEVSFDASTAPGELGVFFFSIGSSSEEGAKVMAMGELDGPAVIRDAEQGMVIARDKDGPHLTSETDGQSQIMTRLWFGYGRSSKGRKGDR